MSECIWDMLAQALTQGGRREGKTTPAQLNKFSLSKIEACLFWGYVLNYRPEEFFVSSFFNREKVPHYNFWFQKVRQLVFEAFKQLRHRKRLTIKVVDDLSIGLIWRYHYSRSSLSHFRARFPTAFKPIVIYKCNPSYRQAPVTDPVYYQNCYKSSVSQFT